MEGNESFKISSSKVVLQILEAIKAEAIKRKENKYIDEIILIISKFNR